MDTFKQRLIKVLYFIPYIGFILYLYHEKKYNYKPTYGVGMFIYHLLSTTIVYQLLYI